MANVTIGWPIYSDPGVTYTPTLSGGSWEADLPLTNLQDRRLHYVARSTDAASASTTFDVDLKVARAVFVLAIPVHNLTTDATIQVQGASTASFATANIVYDTTTLSAFATGLTAENMEGMNVGWTVVLASAETARYWRFAIVDTSNPDGYVELGRVVVAAGWQPTINMAYGARLGLETETGRQYTDGGAAVYTERRVRRTVTCTIPDLPEDEALQNGWDFQRIAQLSRQFMFVWDASDTIHMHRRSFLATLRDLTPLEAIPLARYGVPLVAAEEL